MLRHVLLFLAALVINLVSITEVTVMPQLVYIDAVGDACTSLVLISQIFRDHCLCDSECRVCEHIAPTHLSPRFARSQS